jgi:hypothetical protein
VADDRDALGREPLDDLQAGRAVHTIAAEQGGVVRGTQVVVSRLEMAILQSDLHEALACGLPHRRVPDRSFDRQHVDPRRGAGPRLVTILDVDHRKLSHALERADVGDGGAGSVHGSPVRFSRSRVQELVCNI